MKPPFNLLLLSRWRSFKRQLLNMRSHSDSKGVELKRPNDSIYSFPCPECMCRANRTDDSKSSSAAWSTHGIWLVFLLPMILWACLAAECISDTVIVLFPPPSHSVRRHTHHFWRSKELDQISREWHVLLHMMPIHNRMENVPFQESLPQHWVSYVSHMS